VIKICDHAIELRRVICRSRGGFPAMAMNAAFLLKDLVLLVVSVYLLKQDVQRVLDRAKAAT
jgi:uncharacterized membrane protein YkgB